jgi:hypothetical protein
MPSPTWITIPLWLAETSPIDGSTWLQYGAIGLMCLVLLVFSRALLGFARGAYQREQQRADTAETEVVRLNTMILERALPALLAAAKAAEDAAVVIGAMQHEREVRRQAEALRRGHEELT